MDLQSLKEQVFQANLALVRAGLVVLTWGNVSGVAREAGIMVIKPSGVSYDAMKPQDMVEVSLETGRAVNGSLRPSSDTPTHLVLYREFPEIAGITHTHSTFATSWAQAGHPIPCFGTTHADLAFGPVPLTRPLSPREIETEYEANTGEVIAEHFREHHLKPLETPVVLVASHGPFAWGKSPMQSTENAIALEEVARMAFYTRLLHPQCPEISPALLNKHFLRKHGASAYYGQPKSQ